MLRTVDCDCHTVGKAPSFLAAGSPAENMLGEAAQVAVWHQHGAEHPACEMVISGHVSHT